MRRPEVSNGRKQTLVPTPPQGRGTEVISGFGTRNPQGTGAVRKLGRNSRQLKIDTKRGGA